MQTAYWGPHNSDARFAFLATKGDGGVPHSVTDSLVMPAEESDSASSSVPMVRFGNGSLVLRTSMPTPVNLDYIHVMAWWVVS